MAVTFDMDEVVKKMKDGAQRAKKRDQIHCTIACDQVRKALSEYGCKHMMESGGNGTWKMSGLMFDMTYQLTRREDLQEACRRRIERELEESPFRHIKVEVSRNENNHLPALLLTMDWSHFASEGEGESSGIEGARTRGNVIQKCPICIEEKPMCALTPCGHMCCKKCREKSVTTTCPFCRDQVTSCVALFYAGEELEQKKTGEEPPAVLFSKQPGKKTGEEEPERKKRRISHPSEEEAASSRTPAAQGGGGSDDVCVTSRRGHVSARTSWSPKRKNYSRREC